MGFSFVNQVCVLWLFCINVKTLTPFCLNCILAGGLRELPRLFLVEHIIEVIYK